jgi:hypothetical protein
MQAKAYTRAFIVRLGIGSYRNLATPLESSKKGALRRSLESRLLVVHCITNPTGNGSILCPDGNGERALAGRW